MKQSVKQVFINKQLFLYFYKPIETINLLINH